MNLGSVFLWSVDFNARTPAVSVLGALPSSSGANGITTVPGHPNILLVADSFVGAIWQLDIATGAARLAIQDPALSAGAHQPAVGVNGIHVRDRDLYFTTSQTAVFGRVAFHVEGGNVGAAGAVQTLASLGDGQQPDDFGFDCEGRAWVTVHPGELAVLEAPGHGSAGGWTQVAAVGNATESDADLVAPTSAKFGRGSEVEDKTLYVTTGAGQVVKIDTSEYN
jgi:sugar lactone lactonase YvrE